MQEESKLDDQIITQVPFIFVRHGSTDWSFKQLHLGELNLSLNEKGVKEVKIMAKKLSGLRKPIIISSPRKRTLETASIIAAETDGLIKIEQGIDARYYGDFSRDPERCEQFHETLNEIKLDKNLLEDLLPQDAEKLVIFEKRVIESISSILKNNVNAQVIIVSHGEIYTALCNYLLKNSLNINKGDYQIFSPSHGIDEQKWKISRKIFDGV